MKYLIGLLSLIVLIAFGVVSHMPRLPGETVKIVLPAGHGSGVHIGDGYVITAAHVVGVNATVSITLDDGSEQPETVLWSNKEYDVAFVRTEATMNSAHLSCRVPDQHELIYAEGSPLNMDFLRTNGRIAGFVREIGPWKSAVPVDMTIIMGMSGGPVFDSRRNVVGINIGVAVAPVGFAVSITGIGVIVPGRTICDLLARS